MRPTRILRAGWKERGASSRRRNGTAAGRGQRRVQGICRHDPRRGSVEVVDEHGRTLCLPAMQGGNSCACPSPLPAALRVEARNAAGVPFRAVATEIQVDGHRFHLWAATSMADAYGSLNRLGWLLTALVPGVLVFAAAGGFWISGRASRRSIGSRATSNPFPGAISIGGLTNQGPTTNCAGSPSRSTPCWLVSSRPRRRWRALPRTRPMSSARRSH
jgi:hypothetical protein